MALQECNAQPQGYPPPYELKQPVFRPDPLLDSRFETEYFWYYSEAQEMSLSGMSEANYRPKWINGEPVTFCRARAIEPNECPDCVFVTYAPWSAVKYAKND
jgi:hypothetical protein